MTHMLVLAGGFGTRLRCAVPDVPKPLAPVAGRPYLHYLLAHWAAQGLSELTLLLHYQAEQVEAFLQSEAGSLAKYGCHVRTLVEPTPLGTGGAVAFAVRELNLDCDFLVANADTWLGGGIQQVLALTAPSMATVEVSQAGRYGQVNVDEQGVVNGFVEKQASAGAGLINAGLYHLHSDQFQDWNGQPFSLETALFPSLVQSGILRAVRLNTDFIDIGVPDDYFRFCRWIDSGKKECLGI